MSGTGLEVGQEHLTCMAAASICGNIQEGSVS